MNTVWVLRRVVSEGPMNAALVQVRTLYQYGAFSTEEAASNYAVKNGLSDCFADDVFIK
jgi:hypothetical protein